MPVSDDEFDESSIGFKTYAQIMDRFLVDPLVGQCCVLKQGDEYVRARVIQMLNPIDIVVQNTETRQDLQVTVLDAKLIRREHIRQKVTSIR